MSQAIKTTHYTRRIPQYSSYTKASRNARYNNGQPVLARKIIIQAFICMIIVFLCIWLQNKAEELPQNIISEVRYRVVERNTTPHDIYQSFTDTYEECVQYIQGAD